MSECRQLTEMDIEKIVTYVTETEFMDSDEMYVGDRLILEPFKRESSLRPILFEGQIIFYAELENNTVTKCSFIALPDVNTKNNVVSIFHLTKCKDFITRTIQFVQAYLSDSDFKKLRIMINGNNKEFKYLLQKVGFFQEATLPVYNGQKIMMSINLIHEA